MSTNDVLSIVVGFGPLLVVGMVVYVQHLRLMRDLERDLERERDAEKRVEASVHSS